MIDRSSRRAAAFARTVVLTIAVLSITAPAPLAAQATETAAAVLTSAQVREAAAEARAILDSLLHARHLPGIGAAVSVDGEIVWAEGFGHSNVETGTPITPLSRFRVGSVSKTITAAALAQLMEDGRLDLDAPVQQYVPAFPEKRWAITTRQLGGHLAGIRHYRGREFLDARHYATVAEGLEIFAQDTLLFEPGTRYSYSSYGWNLLSAAVEGAAGTPFLDYMQSHVFDRLGLWNTTADFHSPLIPYRTNYYEMGEDSVLTNSPYVDNSYKWAGGGFLSTASDLVKFADAHARPGFLRQETLDELMTSQRTRDGEPTNYGLGWRTTLDDAGRRVVGHGGGSVGGSTILILYPEERVAVAIICNMSGAPINEALARRVAQPFLEANEGS